MPNKTERDNYMIGILKELYKTQNLPSFIQTVKRMCFRWETLLR